MGYQDHSTYALVPRTVGDKVGGSSFPITTTRMPPAYTTEVSFWSMPIFSEELTSLRSTRRISLRTL